MGLIDYGNDGFMSSGSTNPKKSKRKKKTVDGLSIPKSPDVFADGFSLPTPPKRKSSSSYPTPKRKKRKSRKVTIPVEKSETYFGIDGQEFEESIQGIQTMYHDIKNFKQNVRNAKTKKIHDNVESHKKQEKLNAQRIRDEAYLKKIQQEKQARIQKIQAEKLRKKQHEILDKHGYVEGRKILSKKASMKSSLFSKLRKRVIGY